MGKKLVIDWSVLMYKCWSVIFKKDYVAHTKTGLEVDEFTYNMGIALYELVERFEPEEVVLALDGTHNWRLDFYAEHYAENVDFWRVLPAQDAEGKTVSSYWVAMVDKSLYKIHKNSGLDQWFVDKMKKDAIEGLPNLEDNNLVTPFLSGKMPQYVLDQYPDAPLDITGVGDGDGLKLVIPTYKGNRKGTKWVAKTPKDEFKKHGRNLAFNLAPLVKGVEIYVEDAEGDDVVARYVERNSNHPEPVILVTVDADLRQLFVRNPALVIWDPVKNRFFKETPDRADFKLICKIMGGDTSDNIKGISFPNRGTTFPTVDFNEETGDLKAGKGTVAWIRKIIDPLQAAGKAGGEVWGPVYQAIDKAYEVKDSKTPHPLKATWERNLGLVFIPNIPDEIIAKIDDKLDNYQREEGTLTWEDFGVTEISMRTATNSAVLKIKDDNEFFTNEGF